MENSYLLDTEVAILWGTDKIERTLEERLRNAQNVYLSSASVWEMVIKVRTGKLLLEPSVPTFISDLIDTYSINPLPITLIHTLKIADLPDIHKDPFDRMLVAQAISEDLTLVSSDHNIQRYPVRHHLLRK
jgi:PIN domain nuclease of toxin-antitoxin system